VIKISTFQDIALSLRGLSIAPKTLANFLERKTQLYEEGAGLDASGNTSRTGGDR